MTTSPALQFVVLATSDLGRAFQSHSRRSTSAQSLLIFAGIALAVVALVAVLAYLERRRKVRTVTEDAEMILFRGLCRAHGLSAADVTLLSQLATAKQLERRSDLFVDPQYLASSARRNDEHAARFAALYRSLFGGDPLAA